MKFNVLMRFKTYQHMWWTLRHTLCDLRDGKIQSDGTETAKTILQLMDMIEEKHEVKNNERFEKV